MEGNGRIFGYDLIKALAMFFIVLYHFNSVDFGIVPEDGWYFPNVTKFFYAFCSAGVPLFFMVNGALLSLKHMKLKKCFEKSIRLLFVAIIWTAIFTCVLYPLIQGRGLPSIGEFQNYYWFLYTLSALYWINYVLSKSKRLKFIVLILLIIFPFITNLFWEVYVLIHQEASIPSWGHTGVFTMYSVVYYYLGAFVSKRKFSNAFSVLLLILGLFMVNAEVIIRSTHDKQIYDGVNSCFPTLGALFLSTGLFALLKKIKLDSVGNLKKFISFIGSNTIGIYILHLFCLVQIKEYVFKGEHQNVLIVLLVTFCVVCATAFMSKLINNSKFKMLLKL